MNFSFKRFILYCLRRWYILVACVVLLCVLGVGAQLLLSRVAEKEDAPYYVKQLWVEVDFPDDLPANTATMRMNALYLWLTSDGVFNRVLEEIDSNTLWAAVRPNTGATTDLLALRNVVTFGYRDLSSAIIINISSRDNALSQQIAQIFTREAENYTAVAATATLFEEYTQASNEFSVTASAGISKKMLLLYAVIGGVFGVGILFIMYEFRGRIAKDTARQMFTDAPIFDAGSAASQALLRTRIEQLSGEGGGVMLLSSDPDYNFHELIAPHLHFYRGSGRRAAVIDLSFHDTLPEGAVNITADIASTADDVVYYALGAHTPENERLLYGRELSHAIRSMCGTYDCLLVCCVDVTQHLDVLSYLRDIPHVFIAESVNMSRVANIQTVCDGVRLLGGSIGGYIL